MDSETLLSGIREMISAAVREATTDSEKEQGISRALYTANENVVREQLTQLFSLVESHDIWLHPSKHAPKP